MTYRRAGGEQTHNLLASGDPCTSIVHKESSEIAAAVGAITRAIGAEHDKNLRAWHLIHDSESTLCDCGCLLMYAGEVCPNCATPMPRNGAA